MRPAPEVYPLPRRDGEDGVPAANVVRGRQLRRQGHQLARLDLAVQHLVARAAPRGEVEPAERVVGRRDYRVRILGPSDELDGRLVRALADLEAVRGLDRRAARVSVQRGVRHLGEVEDAELLLGTARGDEVGVVGGVRDGSDDVVVLDGEERLAGVGVPDLAVGC